VIEALYYVQVFFVCGVLFKDLSLSQAHCFGFQPTLCPGPNSQAERTVGAYSLKWLWTGLLAMGEIVDGEFQWVSPIELGITILVIE
jgi:hypothetical protein